MPVCPSGSERRPGVPTTILLDPYLAPSGIPAALDWLRQFLPYLPRLEIDTTELCSVDPPGWPTWFTRDDLISVATKSWFDVPLSVKNKFEQALKQAFWYNFCQCTAASTPAIPAPPAAPADLPATNPPSYFPVGSKPPCLVREGYLENVGAFNRVIIPTIILPTPGPLTLQAVHRYTLIGSVRTDFVLSYQWLTPAGAGLTETFGFAISPGSTELVPIPVGAGRLNTIIHPNAPYTSLDGITTTLNWFCGGDTPNTPNAACCPPDPTLIAALSRIELLVNLIQRQAVPFATIDGPVHAGLTGSGEISIQGVLGYRVSATAIPAYVGEQGGTPPTRWDIGWVRTGYPSGWSDRQFLDVDDKVIAPVLGDATRIGYSLSPGVTVTVTELLREA